MKRRRNRAFSFALYLAVLLGVCACQPMFQDQEDLGIPVAVYQTGTANVDLDHLYSATEQEVHRILPDAYFAGMVFSGTCQELPQLKGRFIFIFKEDRRVGLKTGVIEATASIDTALETMDVSYQDLTEFEVSRTRRGFLGDRGVKHVAALASQHIATLRLTSCDVTLTQVDTWLVRCGPLASLQGDCHFQVDGDRIVSS